MFTSVIDPQFCKNHYLNKPNSSSDLYDSPELENWKDINKFILSRSDVTLLSKEDFKVEELAYDNPLYFKLCSEYYEGKRSNLTLKKEMNGEGIITNNKSLSTFFFTDENKLGFSPSEYGCILFKSKNILEKWIGNPNNSKKYVITGEELIGNKLNSWKDFQQFSHVTDCIVIADNYLFRDKRNIGSNFIPLLDSLVSKSCSLLIQLTVFTKELYPIVNHGGKNEIQVSLNDLYKEINNVIKGKLPELKINLTIIKKKSNDFHDRGIITRYFRIEISNSIAFFDKNGNKIGPSDVTLSPEPHIVLNGKEPYGCIALKQLKALNKIVQGCDCEIVNEKPNMLLEFAKTI